MTSLVLLFHPYMWVLDGLRGLCCLLLTDSDRALGVLCLWSSGIVVFLGAGSCLFVVRSVWCLSLSVCGFVCRRNCLWFSLSVSAAVWHWPCLSLFSIAFPVCRCLTFLLFTAVPVCRSLSVSVCCCLRISNSPVYRCSGPARCLFAAVPVCFSSLLSVSVSVSPLSLFASVPVCLSTI